MAVTSRSGRLARTLLRASALDDGTTLTEIVTDGGVVERHTGNPLDFIDAYQSRFKVALRPGLPRFCGGLAGYFGYDAVRFMEEQPKSEPFSKIALECASAAAHHQRLAPPVSQVTPRHSGGACCTGCNFDTITTVASSSSSPPSSCS